MISPPVPANEDSRLRALRDLEVLDTPREERFDLLTRLAARVFDVPMAYVSLIDENRQWFKSCFGFEGQVGSRDNSFCGHAILSNDPLIVADTWCDPRFRDHPQVTSAPFIRFYAGIPLATSDGHLVGTFCLSDSKPRLLSEEDLVLLRGLAGLALKELNAQKLEKSIKISRRGERSFASVFSSATIGMALISAEGRFLVANPSLCQFFGYTEEELCDKDVLDITAVDDLERSAENLRALVQGEVAWYQMEKRYRTKSSGEKWALLSVSLVHDEENGPLHVIAQIQDIDERKRAEQESLLKSAQLERVKKEHDNVLNAVGDGVHWIGMDGLVKFENPAGMRMLQYEPWEIVGKGAHALMHHSHADGTEYPVQECPIYRTLRDGVSRHVVDETFWRKDGTSFSVEYTCTPTFDEVGKPNGSVVTFSDMTERKRAQKILEDARLSAETANRAKTEFLANMSHEIRTPLNGIVGMTDLMTGTSLTSEQRDFIETIHVSSENLLTIVNDVLDFSKIEFGKLELDYHAFNLLDLIDDVVGLLNFRIAKKRLEFGTGVDENLPIDYVGDATRIRQVLINLVTNAVKFTESGSVILEIVRGTPREEDAPGVQRLVFCVRDTGIGIPQDRLDRLFKVFSQVDASTTRRFGGSGLGLAICQKLVELMGGKITVKSQPDHGSTFSFELPLERGHLPISGADPSIGLDGRRVLIVDDVDLNRRMLTLQLARWGMTWVDVSSGAKALELLQTNERFDAALIDFQMPQTDGLMLAHQIRLLPGMASLPLVLISSQTGDLSMSELTEAGFSAVLAKPTRQNLLRSTLQQIFREPNSVLVPLAQANEATPFLPLKVLVVEDNATNQKVARNILQRLGYEIDLAANGREAVTAVGKKAYDLIFMDLHMPEMDGQEATREIRSRPSFFPRPWIVALTADAQIGEKEKCLESGMDEYLTKPVKIDALKVVIDRLQAKRPQAS